jgi:hypothetical protein
LTKNRHRLCHQKDNNFMYITIILLRHNQKLDKIIAELDKIIAKLDKIVAEQNVKILSKK